MSGSSIVSTNQKIPLPQVFIVPEIAVYYIYGNIMSGGEMAEIQNTTDADFSTMVSEPDKLILVDMWAEWCGPCKMMEPVLEEIAEEYSEKLTVVKLNIDQNQETPLKFGVMNIPTLIFFRDGKEVDRVIGAFPKKQLINRIEPHLH